MTFRKASKVFENFWIVFNRVRRLWQIDSQRFRRVRFQKRVVKQRRDFLPFRHFDVENHFRSERRQTPESVKLVHDRLEHQKVRNGQKVRGSLVFVRNPVVQDAPRQLPSRASSKQTLKAAEFAELVAEIDAVLRSSAPPIAPADERRRKHFVGDERAPEKHLLEHDLVVVGVRVHLRSQQTFRSGVRVAEKVQDDSEAKSCFELSNKTFSKLIL